MKNKIQIIAEFGVNHNNSFNRAKQGIKQAAEAGADWIKFQLYKADTLVTKDAPKFWDWEGDKDKETQYEAYDALDNFDWKYYPELIKVCKEEGIKFMCTPFDFDAVDYLDEIGMEAFKIASSDLTYLSFIKHIAEKQKPIFLSTGAATIGEIEEAVNIIKKTGNKDITLLHCTLSYPTKSENANLNIIKTLRTLFPELKIGLSDHTIGITAPIIAASMGVTAIEKHYTVDKTLGESADHWLSVDPKELKQLVNGVREAEKMMGSKKKEVFECEEETYKFDKRSIVADNNIKEGEVITREMLTCKRPGTGIKPKFIDKIVGREAKEDIKEDTIIKWEQI